MDCFFAAVAARGRPELHGKPVVVCWSASHGGQKDVKSSSEISSANYEARAFGIRAGMRLGRARALCPALLACRYEFQDYAETAEKMARGVLEATPHVMGISCDEVYADMTSRAADPAAAAHALRQAIRRATGGCAASIGCGHNRIMARIATKRAKPDGFFHITYEKSREHGAASTERTPWVAGGYANVYEDKTSQRGQIAATHSLRGGKRCSKQARIHLVRVSRRRPTTMLRRPARRSVGAQVHGVCLYSIWLLLNLSVTSAARSRRACRLSELVGAP